MPSIGHEVLLEVFKNRPRLAAEMLAEVLGVSLPAYTGERLASAELTEIQPAEYRADAVVLLLDQDVPVRIIIVEIQLSTDSRKRFSWPVYATVSRARHQCLADLLIVAPDPDTARWCGAPIEIGAGFTFRPTVLSWSAIPVVTDPEDAVRRPELGVLSAVAHAETEQGAAIAAAVLPALGGLPADRAKLYYDLVVSSLPAAARRALEEMMKGYEYQSDFARKYVAQGRAEGRAEDLLTVLRVRGLAVPDTLRERILAEKDAARLERWLEKAVVATSVSEVFAEPS